jgi:hypothetical protein
MPFDVEYTNTPTDFTAGDTNVTFGSADQIATSVVKRAVTLTIADDDESGKEMLHIDLDRTLTDEIDNLASYYEEFEIKDLHISIQSTSPMGSASGALQVCHIPDPVNSTLGTDLAENLTKVVRQSGSVIVRPRDTKDLKIDTNQTCFTKTSSDKRFSSFGAIVGIVRDTPTSGDTATWTTTLECTVQFIRPTIVSTTTVFTDQLVLTKTAVTNNKIYFTLPDIPTNSKIEVHLRSPCLIRYDVLNKFGIPANTRIRELKEFSLYPTVKPNLFKAHFFELISGKFGSPSLVSEEKLLATVKYTIL